MHLLSAAYLRYCSYDSIMPPTFRRRPANASRKYGCVHLCTAAQDEACPSRHIAPEMINSAQQSMPSGKCVL